MDAGRQDAGAAVVFRDVVKVYNGRVTALDHVSFEIARGTTVALLGPNGAGKSTAIDTMLGLRKPTSGQVRVNGMAPLAAVAAGKIGGMVQTGGRPEGAKVSELIGLFRQLCRGRRGQAELLGLAGLTDIADRRVERLSGGSGDAGVTLPARYALGRPVSGLEVGGGGLEEALLALTSDDGTATPGNPAATPGNPAATPGMRQLRISPISTSGHPAQRAVTDSARCDSQRRDRLQIRLFY
jgi:hypothetical protein